MTQTDNRRPPRGMDGDQTAGEATISVTHAGDDPWPEMSLTVAERELLGRRALADSWHEQTEHEVAVAYALGWRAGVEHASAAMDAAIREAIDPGPDVNPGARKAILDRTAKDVVEQLVREWDWADRRAAVPDRPDYPGRAAA